MANVTEIEIPYGYEAREYQRPVFDAWQEGKRRFNCVWHRRAGKDTTALNFTIARMLERVGSYYHFFPVSTQARKVIWDGYDFSGQPLLGYFPQEIIKGTPNNQEMKLTLINGSQYQLIGTDRALDWIVGTNPIGCIFSEYSLMNPRAWDLIRPVLRENGGWAFFIYTARGENHGYDLFEMSKKNPNWFTSLLTVDDSKRPDGTPVISESDIQEERDEGVDEDIIQQEYYCSFTAAVPGSYFGKEMRRAKKLGRVTAVPHETSFNVDTWWDLGIDDSMTIWFTQSIGQSVRCIRYYENSGFGLDHYIEVLKEFKDDHGYSYGDHHAPHDIVVRELSTGTSRQDTASKKGLDFIAGTKVSRKEDAIEAGRSFISKCWFDEENCKQGIACLRNYRSEYDEKARVRKKIPVHDWASHGADAFMELARHYQPPVSGRQQQYAEG